MANILVTETGDTNINNVPVWLLADQILNYADTRIVIDTEPHLKNGAHLVTITGQAYNSGVLIDGRNIRHLTFSNGSGSLLYNHVVTGATSGATGKFMRIINSNVLKLKQVSGTFVSGETLISTSWSGVAVGGSRIGCMNVIVRKGAQISPFSGGKIEIKGDWFEIGTATGLGTLPVGEYERNIYIPAIWVETSVGSGVYRKWLNKSLAQAFSGVGSTGEFGNWFEHQQNALNITFGNGTNGARPPSGVKVRIPNVIISAGSTTVNGTQDFTGGTFLWGRFHTNNYGELDVDKANVCGVLFNCSAGTSVTLKNWCHISDFTMNNITGRVDLYNGAWCPIPISGGVNAYTFINNCNGGIYVDDCLGCSWGGYGLYMSGCINYSEITNSIFKARTTNNAMYIQYSSNLHLENIQCLTGENAFMEAMLLSECNNVKLKSIQLSSNIRESGTIVATTAIGTGYCNNIEIEGVSVIGGAGFGALVSLNGTTIATIKNTGQRGTPMNAINNNTRFATYSQSAQDIVIANVHLHSTASGLVSGNVTKEVVLQNISHANGNVIATQFTPNMQLKGVQGLDITSNQLVNRDATGAPDYILYDGFNQAGNEGQIGVIFQKQDTRNIYTIVAGTPVFSDLGDLYMRSVGDEVHIEWDYFIKGHENIANINAVLRTSNASATPASTNIEVYYDLDTGSGFSGTWKLATGTNMTAETISATGFKPKFKLVTTTANSGNLVSCLYIRTTTSQSSINANHYPIRPQQATLTLNGLKDNSEVRIYEAGTSTEIAGIENSSGNFQYTYEYQGSSIAVDIVVHHLNYQYLKVSNVTLGSTNSTIPIQQVSDRQYANV